MSLSFSLSERPRPIAPAWHTLAVLLLLATLSTLAVYLRLASADSRLPHLPMYAIVMLFEWATFALTLWGSDAVFNASIARVLREPRSLPWDILTSLVLAAVLLGVTPLIILLMGPSDWVSTRGMIPNNGAEVAGWILMAITAGVCEETIFRGYLQQQLTAWTGLTSAGIIGQAIIFAGFHTYQGWKNVILIGVWGVVLGLAAWLRKGLRGNMIAHAILDAISIL